MDPPPGEPKMSLQEYIDKEDKNSPEFATENLRSDSNGADGSPTPGSAQFSLANLVVPIVALLVAIGAGVYMYLLTTSVLSFRIP